MTDNDVAQYRGAAGEMRFAFLLLVIFMLTITIEAKTPRHLYRHHGHINNKHLRLILRTDRGRGRHPLRLIVRMSNVSQIADIY